VPHDQRSPNTRDGSNRGLSFVSPICLRLAETPAHAGDLAHGWRGKGALRAPTMFASAQVVDWGWAVE